MNKYIVSWYWNGQLYTESFPTLLQAQFRYWKLMDNNSASISVKD